MHISLVAERSKITQARSRFHKREHKRSLSAWHSQRSLLFQQKNSRTNS